MSHPVTKTKRGFCRVCLKNHGHFRAFTNRFFYTLDFLSLGIAAIFRIGPWHCKHCLSKSLYLKKERRDAPQFRVKETESNSSAVASERVEDTKVAQPIGNLLKTEKSLVMRSKRLKRFSEKYRDSIVRRLLSGKSTILQIREEKNISEGELVDWIADLVERMQAKINWMESSENSSPTTRLLDEQPGESRVESIPIAPTVEGQVRPR